MSTLNRILCNILLQIQWYKVYENISAKLLIRLQYAHEISFGTHFVHHFVFV